MRVFMNPRCPNHHQLRLDIDHYSWWCDQCGIRYEHPAIELAEAWPIRPVWKETRDIASDLEMMAGHMDACLDSLVRAL